MKNWQHKQINKKIQQYLQSKVDEYNYQIRQVQKYKNLEDFEKMGLFENNKLEKTNGN